MTIRRWRTATSRCPGAPPRNARWVGPNRGQDAMPDLVTLAPDVVLRVINGEALLLKLNAEDVFALNDTGTRIVQLFAEGRDLDAVLEALHEEYGVERTELRQAISELVDALRARGLVAVRREAAPNA
jgi:hypothetical protein